MKNLLLKTGKTLALPAIVYCLFLLMCFSFSNYVWTFEVTGNETVSTARILSALEEEGIRIHTIPCAELSRGRGGPRCMSMPLWRENP